MVQKVLLIAIASFKLQYHVGDQFAVKWKAGQARHEVCVVFVRYCDKI